MTHSLQADVNSTGKVTAADAATFLKRSNLKEGTLHQVFFVINDKHLLLFSFLMFIF